MTNAFLICKNLKKKNCIIYFCSNCKKFKQYFQNYTICFNLSSNNFCLMGIKFSDGIVFPFLTFNTSKRGEFNISPRESPTYGIISSSQQLPNFALMKNRTRICNFIVIAMILWCFKKLSRNQIYLRYLFKGRKKCVSLLPDHLLVLLR